MAAIREYRPDVDGLRAIAVAFVIAYHAFPEVRTGGFVGVDIFFVISGFLITRLVVSDLTAGSFSLAEFYRRRVLRIAPALLVVLAAGALAGWFLLLPSELQWLGRSMAWSASFVANAFFARAGSAYFGNNMDTMPLLHLWSLGVEEQFYLLWPALMMLAHRKGLTRSVIVAVLVTSLAINVRGMLHTPVSSFYVLGARAWELAAGAMLAVGSRPTALNAGLVSSVRARWCSPNASSLGGLAVLLAVFLLPGAERVGLGALGILPAVGAVLLIVSGPFAIVNRWILAARPLVFVGRISYPLYLWHWPLFSFARIASGHAPTPKMATCLIAIAAVAAYATWRFVELPVRYGVGRRAVPALLVGLAVFSVWGFGAGERWFPGRLSTPAFASWDEASNDFQFPAHRGPDGLAVAGHGTHTTLFIGDSHVQQYWARVVRILEQHRELDRSAVFSTYHSCPPMPDVNSTNRGQDCTGSFDFALRQALRPEVDTVVFGAFWEAYLLGGEYSVPHSAKPVYNVHDPWRRPLSLDSPATQVVLDEFERTIARLVASGRTVFIVLSTPTSPRFDPVPMLPPRARLSLELPDSLAIHDAVPVDVQAFASYVGPLSARFRQIAGRTGALIVDPLPALCEATLCPAVGADGLPLYVDSNHLRARYARDRASFVDSMLLRPGPRESDSLEQQKHETAADRP